MPTQTGIGLGMQVVDAKHVYGAAQKHWAPIKAIGGTEAQLKTFQGTIEHCEKLILGILEAQGPSLDAVRVELKDLLGEMRTKGGLIAFDMSGHNPVVERELKLDRPYPANDSKMRGYVTGLPKAIKRYSAQLATRGFDKQEQARLTELCQQFLQLLKARGKERGEARAARAKREALFETLRYQTSYFRRLGRAALMNSAERADFDRVKRGPRQGKKAAEQPQSAPVTAGLPMMAAGVK